MPFEINSNWGIKGASVCCRGKRRIELSLASSGQLHRTCSSLFLLILLCQRGSWKKVKSMTGRNECLRSYRGRKWCEDSGRTCSTFAFMRFEKKEEEDARADYMICEH